MMFLAEVAQATPSDALSWVSIVASAISPIASAAVALYVIGKKQGAKDQALADSLTKLQAADGLVEASIREVAENMQQVVSRMEDLDRRTHDHDVKLAKLEAALANLAQVAVDIATIRSELGALRSDVGRVQGAIEVSNLKARPR